MREAIGGTWIFSIVIVFVVLFSSYLAISVNYSKAFKVKNKIVTIIEQKEGLSSSAQDEIKSYLDGVGYFVYGKCNTNEKGFDPNSSLNGTYKYCVSCKKSGTDVFSKNYYYVRVFFRLDLPILGEIFTFPITGETKAVHFANDAGALTCSQ